MIKETKYQKAKQLAREYVANFGHFETKQLAENEGWSIELGQYIHQTAVTQACMIEGVNAPYTLPPHLKYLDAEDERIYVDYCRQKAKTGAIHVPISKTVIAGLQEFNKRKASHG